MMGKRMTIMAAMPASVAAAIVDEATSDEPAVDPNEGKDLARKGTTTSSRLSPRPASSRSRVSNTRLCMAPNRCTVASGRSLTQPT